MSCAIDIAKLGEMADPRVLGDIQGVEETSIGETACLNIKFAADLL
jgi:hypothetical protein